MSIVSKRFRSMQFQHLNLSLIISNQQRRSQEGIRNEIEGSKVGSKGLMVLNVVIREVRPKEARLNHEQLSVVQQLFSGQQGQFSQQVE